MTQLAVRLDAPATEAVNRLVHRTGKGRSQIIREAVVLYDRVDLLAQMRAESAALRDDEKDMQNSERIYSEMKARRAW